METNLKFSNLKGKRIAIHCPTEELYKKADKILRNNGIHLDKVVKTGEVWVPSEKNTFFLVTQKELQQCHINWLNKYSYQIISAEDFLLWNEPLPEKWAIKITKENQKEVGGWFSKNSQTRSDDYHNHSGYLGGYLHYPALGISYNNSSYHKQTSINSKYTEISLEKFKLFLLNEQLTDKKDMENKAKYSWKDVRDGKIAIDYTKNKDLDKLNRILNRAFPNDISAKGDGHYYGKNIFRQNEWIVISDENILKVPLNEILEKEDGDVITYKVLKGFPNIEGLKVGDSITISSGYFTTAHEFPEFLQPIYEEPSVNITMHSDAGEFELQVSKKGVYYVDGNNWVELDIIEKVLELTKEHVNYLSNTGLPLGNWSFNIQKIDIGCKKNIPLSDWVKVINEYKRLNGN